MRNRMVGFRILAVVCGKQSRNPTVCYHPDNPGTIGYNGGKCVKSRCPVWSDLEKANTHSSGGEKEN